MLEPHQGKEKSFLDLIVGKLFVYHCYRVWYKEHRRTLRRGGAFRLALLSVNVNVVTVVPCDLCSIHCLFSFGYFDFVLDFVKLQKDCLD